MKVIDTIFTAIGRACARAAVRAAAAAVATGTLAAAASLPAAAQDYPARPIKLVVGFAPGGGSDTMARLLATALGEKLGQPIVVENRPGANTMIATQYVKGQPADGYTLLFTSASLVINPALQEVGYDFDKDFTPVALVDSIPLLLVVNNDVPARSVEELVAYAKGRSSELSYASFGVGSAAHLATEQLLGRTGVDMVHVPYKGSAPGLVDVMGGHVTLMMPGIGSAVDLVRSGKVRALAVSSSKRASAMPDVPTIAESGVAGFELVTWETILAPAGTPAEIVAALNAAIREIVAAPQMRERMIGLGAEPEAKRSPSEVAGFIRSEAGKFDRIIRERGIESQ